MKSKEDKVLCKLFWGKDWVEKQIAGGGLMNLAMVVIAIYLGLNSVYSCTNCGGLCQITEGMKTATQVVMTRLKGSEERVITKQCPHCHTTNEFKPLIDRSIKED